METDDRCAYPPPDAGQTPRRWASVHGAVVISAWGLCVSGVVPLLLDTQRAAMAGAGFAAAMAVAMFSTGRALTPQRLMGGSGMNARSFAVFFHGQTLGSFFCAAMLGAAAGTWGFAIARVLLVGVVAATLLSLLTPYCAGRFAYLVLFERTARR